MGALLRGIKREDISRGMVVCAPGTIKSVKKFAAQIYVSCYEDLATVASDYFPSKVLKKDEGKWFMHDIGLENEGY
jgi:GTPase